MNRREFLIRAGSSVAAIAVAAGTSVALVETALAEPSVPWDFDEYVTLSEVRAHGISLVSRVSTITVGAKTKTGSMLIWTAAFNSLNGLLWWPEDSIIFTRSHRPVITVSDDVAASATFRDQDGVLHVLMCGPGFQDVIKVGSPITYDKRLLGN